MEKMIKPSISIPKELVRKVKEYQKENFLPSSSATITVLVFRGLKSEEEKMNGINQSNSK